VPHRRYDPHIELHEIGNTYVVRDQRFVISFLNGEPEPGSRITTPKAALRATLVFLGGSDGYQNVWYVFDRETRTMHSFKQGDAGVILASLDLA